MKLETPPPAARRRAPSAPTAASPRTATSPRTGRTRFLLLIIDPQPDAVSALHRYLLDLQMDVIVTADAAEGLLQAGALHPDAVLVAADVPPMRGESIVRAVQGASGIPTLVGVDRADREHAQAMAAAGALAAVARPYRAREILPILRSISPGPPADFAPAIQIGSLRLDPVAHEVLLRGSRVELRMREFELLHLLMVHAGRVVTRRKIRELVWNGEGETSNTLSVHVKRLRAKLGDDPRRPRIIVSIRGLGYRLEGPA